MHWHNLNADVKIGARKCKVRKRACSSSSSSSLAHNSRLKRSFLLAKRLGSTTPVPNWKMMTYKSPSMDENHKPLPAVKGGEFSVSARKLAATLWELDGGMPLKRSDVEVVGKQRGFGSTALVLSDLISEKMDGPAHRRRASASSQKLVAADCNSATTKSPHNSMIQADQIENHARSPCRQIIGAKNRFKEVWNGLVTSKELLKVMGRVCRVDEQNSTSMSLFCALKFELDRACIHMGKLIQDQRTKGGEIDDVLKHLEEERIVWKFKEEDRIRRAISCELEKERKLRKEMERLNKNLGRELAETKAALLKKTREVESEKRAREMLEQVCNELARGIGEDRAEVEEMKRRSEKVRQEVEKEREMLQMADVLREERVQMKLAEAKFEFEQKNEVVDKMRNELEAYLKTKKGEKRGTESPSYIQIKELEKHLRETLPSSYVYQNVKTDDEDEDEDEDDDEDEDEDDDSVNSDVHSIELNKMNKQETLDDFDKRGLFEFSSKAWKKDVEEDELERYNMIKNLRDRIFSTSGIASSQNEPTSGVSCEGL